MKNEDYIKCIISIMTFLVLSDDEVNEQKTVNTDSNKLMTKILEKYGYDMITFTEHLSKDKLWKQSPKEFFSNDEKCLSFFISKLNEYIEKIKMKEI